MPTTYAVSTTAVMLAAEADAKAQCAAAMTNYQHATATIATAREYASCVRKVYGDGEPLTGTETALLKLAIVCVFVCAGVGALKFEPGGDISDKAMGALIGAALGAATIFAIGLVSAGVAFLFS